MGVVKNHDWVRKPIPQPQRFFEELDDRQRRFGPFPSRQEMEAFLQKVSRKIDDEKIGDGSEVLKFLIRKRILVNEPGKKRWYFDRALAGEQHDFVHQYRMEPPLPSMSLEQQIAGIRQRLGLDVAEKAKNVDRKEHDGERLVQAASQSEESDVLVQPQIEFEQTEMIAVPSIPSVLAAEGKECETIEITVPEVKQITLDELRRTTPIQWALALTLCEQEIWELLLAATTEQSLLRNRHGNFVLRLGIQADPEEAYEFWRDTVKCCDRRAFIEGLSRFVNDTVFVSRIGESTPGKDAYQWRLSPYSFFLVPILVSVREVADAAFIAFMERLERDSSVIAGHMSDPQHGIAALHEWLRANGYREEWTGKPYTEFAKDLLWMDGCDESWAWFVKLDDDRVVAVMNGFQGVRLRPRVNEPQGFSEKPVTRSVVVDDEPPVPVPASIPAPEPVPEPEPVPVPVQVSDVPDVSSESRIFPELEEETSDRIRERQVEMRAMIVKMTAWLEASDVVLAKRAEQHAGMLKKLRQDLDRERKLAAQLRQKLAAKRAERDKAHERLLQLG